MNAGGSKDHLLKELEAQASKWVQEQLTARMQAVGVDKEEVRKQLTIEAERWVEYNVAQRSQGKKGTPSPDFYQHEDKPELDPTVRTGVKGDTPAWGKDN